MPHFWTDTSQRGLWQSMSDNVKLTPYYIIDIKVLPPH